MILVPQGGTEADSSHLATGNMGPWSVWVLHVGDLRPAAVVKAAHTMATVQPSSMAGDSTEPQVQLQVLLNGL